MPVQNPVFPQLLASSGVGVISIGSGTMNTTDGALTLTTALAAQPSGTVQVFCAASAGLTAGLYYATFSSTSALQLWTDAAATVKPATSAGAYTADLNDNTLATISLPAGIMGANGVLEVITLWQVPNNANAKNGRVKMGGATWKDANLASTASCRDMCRIMNRGSQAVQICGVQSAVSFGTSSSNPVTGAVNTASAQTITITALRGAAGDSIKLEAYEIYVWPKA